MEQTIKARIVLAHADTGEEQIALPNELILYDFEKPLTDKSDNKEIRLRIGDGEKAIYELSDLILDNMHYYDSEPIEPEVGDVWYNEAEETFYLGTGKEDNKFIKLSHVIENIEDGLGEKSIQTTKSSIAGSKCFKFEKQEENSTIKIHSKTAYQLKGITPEIAQQVNETINGSFLDFSMKLTNNYDYAGKATSLSDNGILTVEPYAYFTGYPDDGIKDSNGKDTTTISEESYLFFPDYPDLGTELLGEGAIALGVNNKAQNNATFVEGQDNLAAGQYAHAEGRRTKAKAYASHAEGIDTEASGQRSHAEGDQTKAEGYASHAEGLKSKTIGKQAHAEGAQNVAEGDQAHAEGSNTWAKGQAAHSEGLRGAAIGDHSHVEGRAITEPFNENGELKSWTKEAGLSIAEGEASHVEGLHNHTGTSARAAHAEGEKTEALGANAHAEGNSTLASGDYAHAEGLGYTDEKGIFNSIIASGKASHAEGRGTQARGESSHSEGKDTEATQNNAHAEGLSTHATNVNAHAEGQSTTASGKNSHAEGYNATAKGESSHVEGESTIASGKNQHVQGRYNIEDTEVTEEKPEGKYAHIVGNGTSGERSNAHTLDWEGNAWYAGDIEAGADIVATGKLKSNSLNINDKTSIDENGKLTIDSIESTSLNLKDKDENNVASLFINNEQVIDDKRNITGIQGNFQKLNVADKILLNANNTGDISTSGSLDVLGNGHFDNGLTIGGKHYGLVDEDGNQYIRYENPVLNYRGVVTNLTEVENAKPGDIVCIENLIEQKLIGFKVPKKEGGYIGDSFYESYTSLYTNEFREFEATSPYGKIVAFLLDDYETTYNITPEEWGASDGFILHSNNALNQFKISFTFDNNKTSIFMPGSISERSRTAVGYGDSNFEIDKEAFYDGYKIKGQLFYDSQMYDNFHNYDVIIKYIEIEKDMPPYESVPEELKEYAIVEPQETSNYYLYDGKEWNDLTYNGKQLQSLISSHCMPTIGYSNNSKYKVSVGGENIVDLLKQAFNEGENIVYIESGKYTSLKVYTLPKGNFTIVGLGDVNLNFIINDNPVIKNEFIYTFNNITFSKGLSFNYITDDNSGEYYYNSLKANSCQFNDEISIWPKGEFNNCIFNSNITVPTDHPVGAIFNKCEFYNISRIAGWQFIDCKFYYFNSQIEKIFFGGEATQHEFQFYNCTFQLNDKNIECFYKENYYGEKLQGFIKNSSFLQYPFTNIEVIDKDSCYINTFIDNDSDLNYKGIITSEELFKIEGQEGDLYNIEDEVYINDDISNKKEKYQFTFNNQKPHINEVGEEEEAWQKNVTVIGPSNEFDEFCNTLCNIYGINFKETESGEKTFDINLQPILNISVQYENKELFGNIIPKTITKTYIEDDDYSLYTLNFIFYTDFYLTENSTIIFNNIVGYDLNKNIFSNINDLIENNILNIIKLTHTIGKTNSLKLKYQNQWIDFLPSGLLNFKGNVETIEKLPQVKNPGDLYNVLSPAQNIENQDQSGIFKGYTNITLGEGTIVFENDKAESSTFEYITKDLNADGIKLIGDYISAYNFGSNQYSSTELNSEKRIIITFNNNSYYLDLTGTEFDSTNKQLKIKGVASIGGYYYPIENIDIISGQIAKIEFLNSAELILQYIDKSIYENSYPSGKWVWSGEEWKFFDQKEIISNQIQYSNTDNPPSILPSGTLYIVYEE